MTLLDTLIEKHKMQQHAAAIRSLARPCIRIHAERTPQEQLSAWESRFGGIPYVPKGTVWPTWETQSFWPFGRTKKLLHLATINCAEAAACDVEGSLPREGLLQFWYAENQPAGYDPKDRGGFRVDYIGSRTELELAQPPRKTTIFECCSAEFMEGVSLPNWEWIEEHAAEHKELPKLDGYEEIENEIQVGGRHQMLGHANLFQGPMELQCQLVSNGMNCGDGSGYKDPRRKELESGALDWRVLLELDTDFNGPGWMWGDLGTLYYWIKKDALAARQFEKSWAIAHWA